MKQKILFMNPVPVVVANVVQLKPEHINDVNGLQPGILYTYHLTRSIEDVMYIFIDQTKEWCQMDYFDLRDIAVN